MQNNRLAVPCALLALAGMACSAWATNTTETEANDTKAAANPVLNMVAGDTITGNTTGTSTTVAGAASADNFLITVAAPATPGIYRHRLVLTTAGTAGHVGTLRGVGQTASAAGVWDGVTVGTPNTTDTVIQTSITTSNPARMNQWFGMGGNSHQMIYRVTGAAATTSDYVATLSTSQVTPISGPTIFPGNTVISTIGQTTTDTDMWLYDANFNPILGAGCDDESTNGGGTGATLQSRLTRNLASGTYYLAISRYNLASSNPSPNDDDFRTGALLDFPGAVCGSSSTTTAADLDVSIGGNVVTILGTAGEGFDVQFVQINVVNQTNASCALSTGVEGQNVAIRLNVNPASGTTITSATVNASSINPSATNVALSDLGGGVWGADVLSTAIAGAYSFSYSVTDSAAANVTGNCPVTVTASASGACCTSGSCAISTTYQCTVGGGTFQGAGTNCGLPTYTAGPSMASFSPIAGTGTLLTTISACDDCGENVALPFAAPFDFYGSPFTSIGVSSNGMVRFGAFDASLGNAPIPTAATPNNFAAALWDDLNPGVAGDVYTFYNSVNNTFTISWENVTQFGVTDVNNIQVILHGNTNNIEFVYGDLGVEGSVGDWTAGIEDSTGSAASVNAGTPVANTAVLITYVAGVNPCGPSCDTIDFNNDGLFPDTMDIDDFLSVFSGGSCSNDPNCGDIDYNNDGLFPDTLDIDALLSVFSGGPCLV